MGQGLGRLGDRQAVLQRPHQRAGIQISRSGGHHQSFRRREAHRGVQRMPTSGRSHRGAGSEMADDGPETVTRTVEQGGRAANSPGAAESVEAVAADPPAGDPLRRDGVSGGFSRKPGVKGRVETTDRWPVREYRPDGVQGVQGRGILEGGQRPGGLRARPGTRRLPRASGCSGALRAPPGGRPRRWFPRGTDEVGQLVGQTGVGGTQVPGRLDPVSFVDHPQLDAGRPALTTSIRISARPYERPVMAATSNPESPRGPPRTGGCTPCGGSAGLASPAAGSLRPARGREPDRSRR